MGKWATYLKKGRPNKRTHKRPQLDLARYYLAKCLKKSRTV